VCARAGFFTKDPHEHFSRALNIFLGPYKRPFVCEFVCAAYIVRVIVYCCAYIHIYNTMKRSRGGELTGINGEKKNNRSLSALRNRVFCVCACSPCIRDFGTPFQMFWHKDFVEHIYTRIPLFLCEPAMVVTTTK